MFLCAKFYVVHPVEHKYEACKKNVSFASEQKKKPINLAKSHKNKAKQSDNAAEAVE